MDSPPTSIRPQNALNERETMETEVISCVVSIYTEFARLESKSAILKKNRTAYSFLF